jgi:hypothetical protein
VAVSLSKVRIGPAAVFETAKSKLRSRTVRKTSAGVRMGVIFTEDDGPAQGRSRIERDRAAGSLLPKALG